MADNLGPMAWLFLPENVQVQYLQKNAQMRKKNLRPQILNDTVEAYFLHEVQFSAAIEAAHFPDCETGYWRHCLCAAKAVPMNGAPSSNADKAAFRRLPFSPYHKHIRKKNFRWRQGRCPLSYEKESRIRESELSLLHDSFHNAHSRMGCLHRKRKRLQSLE